MRTALLGLGLYFLAQLPLWQPPLRAQCSSRDAFRARLRRITAPHLVLDTLVLSPQRKKLETWLLDWRKCHPRADSSYVVALSELALLHYYAGYISDENYAPAIATAREAIAVYRHPSLALRGSDLALAYYRLGVYYNYDEQALKAIEALSRAIELGEDRPEALKSISSAYPYVIFHYYSTGDYQRALQYAEAGEKIAYRLGENDKTSKLLEQKAQVLAELGRLAEARQAADTAITLIQKYPQHHRTLASEERLLAGILHDMGQLAESRVHYFRAYELAQKHNHEDLSDYAVALGGAFLDSGDDTRALGYFQEALRIGRATFSESILLNYLGVVYRKRQDFTQALEYHQQGLNALSVGYRITAITALPPARLISLEPHKGYFLSIVQDKADTWLAYARHTRNGRQKLVHARRTYMLADSMIDLMRREHSGETTKLVWRNKARAMYERAIETCYLLGDPGGALHFFEKSRAVLLNDQLNERLAEKKLTRNQAARKQVLWQKFRKLENKLDGGSFSDSTGTRLRNELLAAQAEQEEFIKNLEKQNPQYYRLKYNYRVPDAATIHEDVLGGEGTFVSYFLGDSALYGICVDAQRLVLRKLDRDGYFRHIGAFRESMQGKVRKNSQWAAYQSAAHGLYQVLVEPFELEKGTKLVVSPDGDFIPFAAFSLSPTEPDYLVKYHAITYTYSAGFLERSPRAPADWWATFRAFLGVAPVDFAPALQQAHLPGSGRALKEIGNHFLFSKKLLGKKASRNSFETLVPNYRIAQLFTHATADSSGVEPKLYFSDAVLRLSDLPDTTYRTQLMVLSACQTGLGQNQRGEGVFSLARGFAAVGVPSTLTTLWSVEDRATYDLTGTFYQYLTDGFPVDEALQQAQIQWLESSDDQQPYYWAGVVLLGQRAPLGRYYGGWIYGGGLALLLVLAGLFWWTKTRKPIGRFAPPPDSP